MAERHKILIVDDLESNRMIMVEIFQEYYQILEASGPPLVIFSLP